MSLNLDRSNWVQYASSELDRSVWTVIVPAAGRGSRLGSDKPKLLYEVAGRAVLDWLLDFLEPVCGRFVFVLSPQGQPIIGPELEKRISGRYDVAIQVSPTGMGDAVYSGLELVRSAQVAVVWGDQVALRPSSVAICMRLHDGTLRPDITCPTVVRTNPYIHFERDGADRITRLLQAREGDTMPMIGESDTGFFCFRTEALRHLLNETRSTGERGERTNECNLLPVIPLAAREGRPVLTPRIMQSEEAVGINTIEDAINAAIFLRNVYQ